MADAISIPISMSFVYPMGPEHLLITWVGRLAILSTTLCSPDTPEHGGTPSTLIEQL